MRSIFISLLFLLPFLCFSQLEIKGKVISKTETIAFANVILSTPGSDGTVITGAITDENGNFTLMAKEGTYTLAIRFMGYTEWQQDIVLNNTVDLGTITLESSTTSLDEVVITKTKKVIERKPDRLVFNVENSIAASGGDALDALKIAPGVTVQNNTLSMIGRGASRVMVDGRILQLSGEELIDFLNGIAASDIKKIEIITNPPAKYEAAGNGGLINIIYKKGARNSWKNTTTLAYNQNTYNFTTLRNNFFYNKNKLRFSVTANGTKGNIREIEEVDVYYPNGPWVLDMDNKANKDNISGRLSIDYDITDNIIVGAQYLGNQNTPDNTVQSTTQIFNATNQLDSILDNTGFFDRKVKSHLYNLHMITTLDTLDRKISFDIDYFDYDNTLKQDNVVNTLLPNGEFVGINYAAMNLSDQRIDNFSAKIDVEHPFPSVNLSYGGKLSFIKTINGLQNFTTETGTPVFDPISSNQFEYTENIQALYVNASKKINDKWEFQLGLRVENTLTEGFSETLNQTNTNEYLKFFPTAYISYQKNDNNIFSLNYGRRINRPGFRNLNPFRIYVNSNSFSEGNPFLQPSFTDTFEFNHTYNNTLTTNAFLNITTDGFGTIFTADQETEVQAVIRENYYKSYNWGIGETFSFSTLPWWKSQNQVYVLGYKTVIDDAINANAEDGFQLHLSTNNTFTLSKTTKLQLNFVYNSPHKTNLFDISETYNLNLALKQSMFKDKLQLSVLVNDILDTSSYSRLASVVNGIETVYAQNYSPRFARISLSYTFGNNKIKGKQRGFGNDEERNRSN
ncbi:hypothetical protein IWQ47_001313 [Aquimarina sp. EL_43]|uniref:TonB-dependent receptor domain-containing protein n=1 Tax=unclassified Aquimarina TaxID=2627091 RepID=UPI0018C9B305|nr:MULTISPECIES: TonB-dependent receptor [unclassified Aquimarina]MBG6129384.1 hypothetical protein [Aquimarina sp. EL_35]MBG6150449.1 hypothetical protein [Aquimarina sp. EL_32]MBG6168243.1 hypothetical protein [Aquimarina sp. EL_43]